MFLQQEEERSLRNLDAIYAIRAFSRFFTNSLGIVDGNIPTNYPISKGRILYEIGKTEDCTFSILCNSLKLDQGYISRILDQFEKDGFIVRRQAPNDRRMDFLFLTDQGTEKLNELIDACNHLVQELIVNLSDEEINEVVFCMKRVEEILRKN